MSASSPLPIGVLLSGRGSNMVALAEAAPGAGYRIACVASDNPDAPGIAWAAAHGLPTFAAHPPRGGKAAWEAEVDVFLRAQGVELIALAGYMRLLSPGFVARWPARILNIHPSLLPAYKGLHTHARALVAGDREAGCSVHLVTAELDDGPVLGRARVPVLAGDTPDTLAARVLIQEHLLYPRILSEYARAMTDPTDRIRQVALQLPGAHEQDGAFVVEGEPFARVAGDTLSTRAEAGWDDLALAGDVDWQLVEDRVARGWELAAPAGLLEAGGR